MRRPMYGLFALLSLWMTHSTATPLGININYSLLKGVPENLKGYRIAGSYRPEYLDWNHIQIYFDAAVGHWWVTNSSPNRSLTTLSTAPYLRLYLQRNLISPYLEGSIGLSYLTRSRIDDRNLGGHFQFQDQASIGMSFGKCQQWDLAVGFVHYSNARFYAHNSGFTAPLFLNLGYRF